MALRPRNHWRTSSHGKNDILPRFHHTFPVGTRVVPVAHAVVSCVSQSVLFVFERMNKRQVEA